MRRGKSCISSPTKNILCFFRVIITHKIANSLILPASLLSKKKNKNIKSTKKEIHIKTAQNTNTTFFYSENSLQLKSEIAEPKLQLQCWMLQLVWPGFNLVWLSFIGAKTIANNVWSIQHVFAKCKQTHSYFYGCISLTLVCVILTLPLLMCQRIQGAQGCGFLLVVPSIPIHWMHLLSLLCCTCLHNS